MAMVSPLLYSQLALLALRPVASPLAQAQRDPASRASHAYQAHAPACY